ncbi:helix-turn-helix domain-containing protein [Nocardioides mesophilus]|uniref:Helix-turn-helix domain-containing protein n=1 Tax=Nocardioides mesophilus TaxID=433659 RepID=A0A7G9RGW7_9ACTN|nr:helix-turn-helix domain-containing protein [Nocardioides mesophilus]
MEAAQHAARGRTARGAAELDLDEATTERLRSQLPRVAEHTVRAVIIEVPSYAGALRGAMGTNIEEAVQLALGGFLSLAARPRGTDPGTPLAPALEGAYALGRGEARSGRTMDALLSAYRVGARVSWRELSAQAVDAGLDAATLAKFAELVFAYIDELSAASVAGHTDELATTGRVRRRYLQRLGRSLLLGAPADQLAAAAARADWDPPRTLTAVVMPGEQARRVLSGLDPRTLRPEEDLPDLEGEDENEIAVLLVPDADRPARTALVRSLRGRQAYIGPARPWTAVRSSYLRVLRARRLGLLDAAGPQPDPEAGVCDTEQHLTSLVLGADPAALADLRAQVLEPLAGLRPSTAERLAETLHAWLLHQGRRDDVARALHVHPQTVRYRMGQVRELYGDALNDPGTVLALTVALAGRAAPVEPQVTE